VLNVSSHALQRFCHTQSNSEVEELLMGIKRRLNLLGCAEPEVAVADNCCHVKHAIRRVFPDIAVCLDVWHFMMRYITCLAGGTKNMYRSQVADDLVGAILKTRAQDKAPAVYWSQEEQERRLEQVFKKWADHGDVWTVAAQKAHLEQLGHVQKGCLARPRDDVRSDGSRIEGAHKGWNGLQRSHASGLETLTYLCHDFVNRRNIRIESTSTHPPPFIASTHGSHHLRLVNACAKQWNALITSMQVKGRTLPAGIQSRPEMPMIHSGETFGLMKMSVETAAHYALASIKQEPEDDMLDLSSLDILDSDCVLQELGIDPSALHQPLVASAMASSSAVREFPMHSDDLLTTSGFYMTRSQSTMPSTNFFAPRAYSKFVCSTPTSITPRLPIPEIVGATRSQRLFSIATGIDSRCLRFSSTCDSNEFFAFMDLRAKKQWASFKMTPFDWVWAASEYNYEIEKINVKLGKNLPMKTPRALMEKLADVESKILNRIRNDQYACAFVPF
ncbi:hypothetical protein C8Q80DRAFT_1053238, partial [Daedaleopsis nitida]